MPETLITWVVVALYLGGALAVTLTLAAADYRYADFWQSLIILAFAGLAAILIRRTAFYIFVSDPTGPVSHAVSGFIAVTAVTQYIALPGWQRAAMAGGVWGGIALIAGLFSIPL